MSRRRSSRTSTQVVTLSTEAAVRQERLVTALPDRTVRKCTASDDSAATQQADGAEEEYEWETVLDSRHGGKELLVKWKDWPVSDATWELVDQLPPEVIECYRAQSSQSTQASIPEHSTSKSSDVPNEATERPKRRRSVPAHAPVKACAPTRPSASELQGQLKAMGFSAAQVASALSWATSHPKATTAAIIERVLVPQQPPKPSKQSSAALSVTKVDRQRKPAERPSSFKSVDSPTTAAEALLLVDRLHSRVKLQVSVLRREEGMLEAYSGERAQVRAAENGGLVVPQAELQRATARILLAKRKIRSNLRTLRELQSGKGPGPWCFHQLSPAALETEAPDAENSENGIDVADIICSACGSGDDTVAGEQSAVDILLCDAPSCRLAFHNATPCLGKTRVVDPDALKTLLSESSAPEDQEWWCPLCTVMYDSVDLINEYFERSYIPDLSKWELIFSEAAERGASQTASRAGSAHDVGNGAASNSDSDDDFNGESADADNGGDHAKKQHTLRNLDQLSEEMLRLHLQKRNLSTKGKRAVLKTRLQRALATAVTKPQPREPHHVRRAMDLSRILQDGNDTSSSQPEFPSSGSSAVVASADEGGSSSDIELDDEDEDDHNSVEQTIIADGCTRRSSSKVATDKPLTASLGTSSASDCAGSPSPRGRGKRRRQGIDYTCLDIMLFGLPGDVPDEDMANPLSLGKRKPATGTMTNQHDARTSKTLQGLNKEEVEKETKAGSDTARKNSLGQPNGKSKVPRSQRSGEAASSATVDRSSGSSLALLLGDATSDGEGDWSPPKRRRSSKANSKTRKKVHKQSSAAAAAPTENAEDEEAGAHEGFSSSSSSGEEDTED
eukprot:COSAG02_NODE_261_length_26663_cov_210.330899_17_plen_847_part_00